MVLEDWKDTVSLSATIATVINFLTGLQVIRGYVRKGSAGDSSGLPFIVGSLNCAIWLKYGLLIDDWTIKVVNLIGTKNDFQNIQVIIQIPKYIMVSGTTLLASYAIAFYLYTPYKTSSIKQMVFAFGFFMTLSFYVDRVKIVLDLSSPIFISCSLDGRRSRRIKVHSGYCWMRNGSRIFRFPFGIFSSSHSHKMHWSATLSIDCSKLFCYK